MKYCKNCGMLLEDTHERCIKCGADVSIAANVSLYPPEIMKDMASEKEQKKSRNKMVILLIVIFVVLIALIGVVLWKISSGDLDVSMFAPPAVEEVAEEEPEIEEDIPIEEEETEEPVKELNVKDDAGSYFVCKTFTDEAGNPVFNGIYPEDLAVEEFVIDTERYSDRFCELMSFVASDEENTIRFTYMSPQQMWYKSSEKGKTRRDERDPQYYMSFYTFDGAKAYLDGLIKQSYPKAKKIECTAENEVSEALSGKLKDFIKSRSDYFKQSDIGDYAHIGEDTEYASMGSSYSAMMYDYQITDQDKEVMYCKFYIPVMSNDLYYASNAANDMGTITEWYIPCICGFEAGNEDLYDDNKAAFELFCANAVPTKEFFYINSEYRQDILNSIELGEDPMPPTTERLTEIGSSYSDSCELDDVYSQIYDFLGTYCVKSVSGSDMKIYLPEGSAIAYYDKDANKLFTSPDETEYPGSSYEELK